MNPWWLLGLAAVLLAAALMWAFPDPEHRLGRAGPALELFATVLLVGLGLRQLSVGDPYVGGLMTALGGWMLVRRFLGHRHHHGPHG